MEDGSAEPDRHAWERPGAYPVAPGVHRIPLPLPGDALRAVNTYAIDDGDGVVMVDGGWAMAESAALLERALGEIGRTSADIKQFLVTHIHRDHYTQAVALRRVVGATVGLGAGELESLDAIRAYPESSHDAARLRRAGADALADLVTRRTLEVDLADWEYPDVWLADGAEVTLRDRTVRVVATPGHTVGHVVYHDAGAAALFAGDHVLPHITPSIAVQLVDAESPLRDYLDSLRLVLAMPDALLLPAHGPVTPSTHARVEELLRHHERRLTESADAVAAGRHTSFEVATALLWTRRLRDFADLDPFNQILAVNETTAHLDVLVERGWLTRTEHGGVARYER